jgi:uncharacterized protein
MSNEKQEPWYKEGLRFRCTGCGDCCTGGPGFVWVTNDEIAAIAEVLELDVKTFEASFVTKVGVRKSLAEFPGSYDCVFFDSDTRKCRVYPVRPRQCRTWPFWESNIKSPEAWEETCRVCPGSGKGKLYQLEEIQEQAAVIRI